MTGPAFILAAEISRLQYYVLLHLLHLMVRERTNAAFRAGVEGVSTAKVRHQGQILERVSLMRYIEGFVEVRYED